MALFSLKIWKKLTGPRTVTTVDTLTPAPNNSETTINLTGPYDTVTLTAPETTYASALDASGRGYLLLCVVEKPATTNSVGVLAQITLDGTVIATDVSLFGGITTAARKGVLVGQVQDDAPAAIYAGPPVFLPFNNALKIEFKFSATPGASEDITARILAVYN
jgi:hypothetical protein